MIRTATGICLMFAVAAILLAERHVDACAMVRPRGYTAPLEVADESAIIIWDQATKTQHFIRRASFKTEASDFGFLVPTPTRPELAEAKDTAFKLLERLTAPPIIASTPRPAGSRGAPGGAAAPRAPVEVLEIKRVAGFDAAVLKADDAMALNEWLKNHGYQSRPELVSWLEPYIQNRWIITAFKIAGDGPKTRSINTSAVRMSFKTERPFYPYREPTDQRTVEPGIEPISSSGRLLRIYVLSKDRVQANLGIGLWPGKTVWANTISNANCELLAKNLKLEGWSHAGTWWLTEMVDRSSPRPGTDELFFASCEDQSVVAKAPVAGVPLRAVPPRPRPVPRPIPNPQLEPTRKPAPSAPIQ